MPPRDLTVEAMMRRHRDMAISGHTEVKMLLHIGSWLRGRIYAIRVNGVRIRNLQQWLAYILAGTPCNRVSIHRRLADALQNEFPNQRGDFVNSPIVQGTGVRGLYVAADVNTMAYRSMVSILHLVKEMPAHRRLSMGFYGLPINIPVMSMADANRITDISDSGKYCRAYADSEDNCKSLHHHCSWVRSSGGETNCTPKSRATRSAMGTSTQQSARTSQRDVPGIGHRIPRGSSVGRWRRPS